MSERCQLYGCGSPFECVLNAHPVPDGRLISEELWGAMERVLARQNEIVSRSTTRVVVVSRDLMDAARAAFEKERRRRG